MGECLTVFIALLFLYAIVRSAFPSRTSKRRKKKWYTLKDTPAKQRASRSNKIYLYVLYDGRKAFYAGRTNNPKRRLREHIEDGKKRGTKKQRYIYYMSRKPRMDVVASTTSEDRAQKLERQLIAKYGATNTVRY